MTKLQFGLCVIILGLVINLLANMIWKCIPGHLDKIITVILVVICMILLTNYNEENKYKNEVLKLIDSISNSLKQLHRKVENMASVLATNSESLLYSRKDDDFWRGLELVERLRQNTIEVDRQRVEISAVISTLSQIKKTVARS